MQSESAMYLKVRDFIVRHWKAGEALTRHDSGRHAVGRGLSISFGGIRVEPDVYGVVVGNTLEIPILGEGKLRMGGHEGTKAFGQALTYRNLGMLSFLFFPESEFSTDAAPMFKTMCAQAGIGLLKVPSGRTPLGLQEHVVVDLAGGSPNSVASAIEGTLRAIKGIGQRHLADIYPTSLRDVLSLFDERFVAAALLRRKFQTSWRRFVSILRERPYDAMVRKKVARAGTDVAQEYFDKFVSGLLALGLIAPTTDGFRTTDLGEQIRLSISASERFQFEVDLHVRQLFAFAVMRAFEEPMLRSIGTLRHAGMPVSSRPFCLRRACGHNDYRNHIAWLSAKGRARCPLCGCRRVEPGFWLRYSGHNQQSPAIMPYALLKFATSVGLFESRPGAAWKDRFPRVRLRRGDGIPIRWDFHWLGPALTGH